jgi:serine/threonine protein kinase
VLAPGTVVAGYRVERAVGAGGMGTVYAVADPQLPRLDALKVLSAELSADPDFRARFVRESDIAAVLDHPNIVSVYDRGETAAGQLWIAMQFVDGIDADAAVKAGTVTPDRAVHIITGVAEALDYAHARQVVHRDVKPANFLLSGPVGPDERVLLGDFGIARALDDAGMTATGSVVATMAYAAPEVIESRSLDGRADLYSLGCALFRLLTGKTPFYRSSGVAAVVMAHLQKPPPRVTELAPWLPAAFDAVIAKAMAKDPAQRYQSGHELAAAAAAALRTDGTVVLHHDPTRPIARPSAPPWRAPTGPGGGDQQWPSRAPTGPTGWTPDPPRRSRRRLISALIAVVVVAGGGTVAFVATRPDQSAVPAAAPTTSVSAAPTAPPVTDGELPGLLLGLDQLKTLVGVDLVVRQSLPGLTDDTGSMMMTSCMGTMLPIEDKVYADSGYKAAYGQSYAGAAPDSTDQVTEAVVSFGSADLAETFVNRQAVLWDQCANASLTFYGQQGRPNRTWLLGTTTNDDGMVSAVSTPQGRPGDCQHALTARNNVVVDVIACLTPNTGGRAVTIATQIAGKVPQ